MKNSAPVWLTIGTFCLFLVVSLRTNKSVSQLVQTLFLRYVCMFEISVCSFIFFPLHYVPTKVAPISLYFWYNDNKGFQIWTLRWFFFFFGFWRIIQLSQTHPPTSSNNLESSFRWNTFSIPWLAHTHVQKHTFITCCLPSVSSTDADHDKIFLEPITRSPLR